MKIEDVNKKMPNTSELPKITGLSSTTPLDA